MTTDPAAYERRIIEKDRRYLTGAKNGEPVWYWSPYHAWWDEEHGGRFVPEVAMQVGGVVRIFNPITGSIRKEGPGHEHRGNNPEVV